MRVFYVYNYICLFLWLISSSNFPHIYYFAWARRTQTATTFRTPIWK